MTDFAKVKHKTEMYDTSLPNKIPLIIDFGSNRIKAGVGSKLYPQFNEWNCIGKSKEEGSLKQKSKGSFDDKAFYNDVADNTYWYDVRFPFNNGYVPCIEHKQPPPDSDEWFEWLNKIFQEEDYYEYFDYMMHNLLYDKLRSIPEDHPLLLVESYNITQASQEKMVEILFEHFNFPKLIFWKQPACSLFSMGCTDGIVLECGAGTTVCAPVLNGLCVKDATYHSLLGGQYLTEFLGNELNQRHRREINNYFYFDSIKRKFFNCTTNARLLSTANSLDNTNKTKVDLPDGKQIDITEESLKTPMLLFDPIETNNMYQPIHKLFHHTILKLCENDKKHLLDLESFKYLYVTGGTSNMSGFMDVFSEKFKYDPLPIKDTDKRWDNYVRYNDMTVMPIMQNDKVKNYTLNPMESTKNNSSSVNNIRDYSAWLGASVLSSLSSFDKMYVTAKEYDIYGTDVIKKRMLL